MRSRHRSLHARARRAFDAAHARVVGLIGHDDTTTEQELERAGRAIFGNQWAGVYAGDEVPRVSEARPYAIVNTTPRSSGGVHWLGVVNRPGPVEYLFDSFGRPRAVFGRLAVPGLMLSDNAVEDPDDDNCGQLSLAALIVARQNLQLLRVL